MRYRPLAAVLFALCLSAPPSPAEGPSQDAVRLLAEARSLDSHARSAEDGAERNDTASEELLLRAADERSAAARESEPDRSRRIAHAEDMEVRAALERQTAAQQRVQAQRARARARELRALARQRASEPLPPSSAPHATLYVNSSKGPCMVRVDGILRGATPILAMTVAPGLHAISCQSLDGQTLSRSLRVKAGTSSRLTFGENAVSPY